MYGETRVLQRLLMGSDHRIWSEIRQHTCQEIIPLIDCKTRWRKLRRSTCAQHMKLISDKEVGLYKIPPDTQNTKPGGIGIKAQHTQNTKPGGIGIKAQHTIITHVVTESFESTCPTHVAAVLEHVGGDVVVFDACS